MQFYARKVKGGEHGHVLNDGKPGDKEYKWENREKLKGVDGKGEIWQDVSRRGRL